MLSMHKSREELADWRSTKNVPFKQRPILPTKAKRPGKIGLSLMLQGAMISPADIVRSLDIQKTDAGLGQMQYANTARRKVMLKAISRADGTWVEL